MRFRGSVVSSFMTRGWPFGSLTVTSDRLTFRPGFSNAITVLRPEVETIEVRKQRILPFMFRSFVTVRLIEGSYLKTMFVPARTTAVVTALSEAGWPVRWGERLGWASLARSPVP